MKIEELGIIEYKKSRRAKHISIRIKDGERVLVTLPYGVSEERADEFVRSKEKWIRESLRKMSEKKDSQTIYRPANEFRTKFRQMKLLPDDRKNLRLKIFDDYFEIYHPQNVDFESDEVQAVLRKLIEHVLKVEAHEYLPQRMSAIAGLYNMKFKDLKIKNTVSFWGRCGGDDSIVLSLHLMRLPNHLIDYVIIHELCHTVHKNHQKEFWRLLDSMTDGNAKIMAGEMKNYSTRIF